MRKRSLVSLYCVVRGAVPAAPRPPARGFAAGVSVGPDGPI